MSLPSTALPHPEPPAAPTPPPRAVAPAPWWAWPGALVLSVAILAGAWLYHENHLPTPGPGPGPAPAVYDPALVPVGAAYGKTLAPDLAAAIEDGAKLLDAGQPRKAAYDTISKAFSTNRQASYDATVTPALEKVSPQSTPEDKVTITERANLARALRGMAHGLQGTK